MPSITLPTPAQAIAASITADPDHNNGIDVSQFAKQPEVEVEVEPKKPDTKVEEPPPSKPKTIADAASLSDDAPEPEKKVEVIEPTDEPREGEKPAQFIKRLKAERDEAKNRAKQFEEQASKKASASPEEITALRKEIADREALLEETAYERSAKFREQFAKPIEKAATSAKELISKFTETKGVYERAMALDGRERMEFLREHVEDAAATVFGQLAQVDALNKDKSEALASREEISKTLSSERENSETARILREFDGQRENLSKRLSPLRGENAESYWSQARSIIEGSADPETIKVAPVLAVLAPHYIELCKTQAAVIAKLEARIKEDGGDRAHVNGRGSDGAAKKELLTNGRLPSVKQVVGMQLRGEI